MLRGEASVFNGLKLSGYMAVSYSFHIALDPDKMLSVKTMATAEIIPTTTVDAEDSKYRRELGFVIYLKGARVVPKNIPLDYLNTIWIPRTKCSWTDFWFKVQSLIRNDRLYYQRGEDATSTKRIITFDTFFQVLTEAQKGELNDISKTLRIVCQNNEMQYELCEVPKPLSYFPTMAEIGQSLLSVDKLFAERATELPTSALEKIFDGEKILSFSEAKKSKKKGKKKKAKKIVLADPPELGVLRKENNQLKIEIEQKTEILVKKEEETQCVVCLTSKITHAFAPCNHFCICESCVKGLSPVSSSGQVKCIICRQMSTIVKIY